MPIKKAAVKALKQSKKSALRNFKVKQNIKDLMKDSIQLIDGKKNEGLAEKIKSAVKSIDRAVQKKIIKKNTGARKKSRLMKKFNLLGK